MSTSHDHHEQVGPSTVEATVLLTEQAASTTSMPHIDHIALPRVDASISASDHHDHEQAGRPSTVEATPSVTEQAASTSTSVIDVVILPPELDP